jgi:Arm DNA-binding domain/Phage integrase central domain
MTHAKLSEETVKRLPAPDTGNRVTYFAGATIQGAKAPRGFGVRVTAAGARAFLLNYRLRGREHRFTIGAWPDWSVLKAVREARNLRQRVDRGENPIEDRAPSPATAAVASILDEFVARYVRNPKQPLRERTADEYESAFNRLVKPRIGKLGIYEVRRSHIIKMLDEIEDANGPVAADRTLAYVRKAFNWYATRDDQFNVPVVRGMARVKPKERARTRVLSDDEIRAIWPELAKAETFGAFTKMLLFTAQRRDEVAHMSRKEIGSDGIWTIPPSDTKRNAQILSPCPMPHSLS